MIIITGTEVVGMTENKYHKQTGIWNPSEQRLSITLIGCGSGGSFIALTLAKLGFSDRYVFEVGNREHLHRINGLDEENIVRTIKKDVVEGYL